MSEMLERVARSICLTDNGQREGERWLAYVPMAKAAIESMKEPSEEMKKAVEKTERSMGSYYGDYEHIGWEEAWAIAFEVAKSSESYEELLIRYANNDVDKASTVAAKRICEKRGIIWAREG